ncbi:MAG: MBG domain-containing protein, partial [Ekhidna sp.]
FDEVRVWNYGRTDAEINANKASCVSASEQGLAHYYRFNTGSGFTAIDETGNGRNLDIVSSVFNNPAFSFWTTELITCASDCQVPMANTVTIGDLDAPTLSLSSSAFNLDLDATGNATVNLADLVIAASDNCSDSSALVFTADITSFTCDDLGTNTIFVTVTDESGNEATSGTVVNISDVTAPTITLFFTTPLEFAIDATTNEVVLSSADLRSDVQDNCDSNPSIALSKSIFTCSDLGTQTITITATDASGNQSTATEDVVIKDATAPSFTIINPTLELNANGSYVLQQADIVTDLLDNCSAVENITVTFDPTTFSCTNLGTSDFDFTVSDENGNTANATSRIAIVDRIAPLVVTQDLTITLDQNGTVTVDPMQVDNGTSDNCSFTLSLDISTFTTADLGANTVTLTALDAGGNTASATAVVTIEEAKDPQTITFSLQDDAMYGDAPLVLAASASSGLAVTYTVIGAGEIVNSNELQINGAGDIVVTASQIGNDTYDAATEIVETLSVTKANLTATAQDVIITYGSNDILSFSINYTGFVGDDDALVIDQVPTVSSAATVTSDAGVYDLVVSGGSDDNYEFNNVNGTFTIEKANQTIDFPVLTDVDLATTNQAFLSATSDAGLPIIYTVVVGSDIASISSATLTLTNTGTVSVEASQVGTTNYNAATAVTNTFQVIDSRKQDQTITFPAIANASYGNDPIALSATASSGLAVSYSIVSGDDASISGNMLTILGAGTVEIEASQAGDDGFNVADPIIQSLVIDPARITITPDDKEIVLGEDLPTFTYSYVGFVNGEDEMVFDFIPTVGSPTSDINAEGTYPIVVTQDAIATNYVFTNEEGTLEIVRPLSIVEKPNIIFYPNPVVDMIKVKGLNTKATYSIVGLDGKQIQSGFVTNIIDFSRIGSGTYLLIVKGENYEILQEEVIVKR